MLDFLSNKKHQTLNLCKIIVEVSYSFYYQPFLIFLTKRKADNLILDKLINEEIKKAGYDIRNISRFMTPLNIDIFI